jgi:competence protein ComEC
MRPALRSVRGDGVWQRRIALELTSLALTSALAGIASAPFGAYHFGRIQLYFVIANMIAVPLAAFWVMPAGLVSLALMPFGLDWLTLAPMGWGAEAILWVARSTAAWPTATVDAPHMPIWGLATIGLGIAWLGLWRSRLRLFGMVLIATGLLSPVMVRPPDLMVSDDARLIGALVHGQVYLQQHSGAARFTREAWLQYWASGSAVPIPQAGSEADNAIVCANDLCTLRPIAGARGILLVRGTAHPDGCGDIAIIVSAEPARGLCARPWPALVDRFTVWRRGAAAIWLQGRGAYVLTDRTNRGTRPWVPSLPAPHERPLGTAPVAKPE